MTRTARTRLFAATLALTGCGDDGTASSSSTSTDDPASTSSAASTGNDPGDPTTTNATTSGGTMAVSGTTTGTSTGEPATSSTSSTSGDDTTGSTSSAGESTSTSASSTTSSESTSSDSASGTSESSSEESSGGPPINLFKNPSLETWTMAAVPNTTPDEWTNCSNGGLAVDAVPDSCMATPAAGTDGLRYARHFSGEGFAQIIPTIPGHIYALSFDYTAIDMCFGGSPSASFEVLVDGVLLMNTPGGAIPMWNSADMQFMATSDTADICFRKTNDGGQGGLDNLAAFDQG